MKKYFNFALVIVFYLFLPMLSFASVKFDTLSPIVQSDTWLLKGEKIMLKSEETLSSDDAKVGSIVHFTVYRNKTVNSEIVFTDKCHAEAIIEKVVPKKSFGRAASLTIRFVSATTADGELIDLESEAIKVKGVDKKGFTLAMAGGLPLLGILTLSPQGLLMLPFGLIVGALIRGEAAEIDKDKVFQAVIAKNTLLHTKHKGYTSY